MVVQKALLHQFAPALQDRIMAILNNPRTPSDRKNTFLEDLRLCLDNPQSPVITEFIAKYHLAK